MKKRNKILLTIADFAYKAGTSKSVINQLIEKSKIEIVKNDIGNDSVILEDAKKILNSDEILEHRQLTLGERTKTNLNNIYFDQNEIYREEIEKKTNQIDVEISFIVELHKKYSKNYDFLKTESATTASLLLYSRIVHLMMMSNLCIKNYFQDSIYFIRPILEAINLSKYFVILEKENKNLNPIKRWFREDVSPQPKKIRSLVISYLQKINDPKQKPFIEEEINGPYNLLSKPIHNTRNTIFESMQFIIRNDEIEYDSFDYGNPRDLEKINALSEFFLSFLWNIYAGLHFSFRENLNLEKPEIEQIQIRMDKYYKLFREGVKI